MYARVSTRQIQPGQMDEAIRILRDQTVPTVREQRGFKGGPVLVDRNTGKQITISVWETEADLRANDPPGYVDVVAAGPTTREVYEVIVEPRAPGETQVTCARVAYRQLQPDKMDEAIRRYRETLVPALRAQPGATGQGFVLADRSADKIFTVRMWTSEADRTATPPGGDVDDLAVGPTVWELYDVAFQA